MINPFPAIYANFKIWGAKKVLKITDRWRCSISLIASIIVGLCLWQINTIPENWNVLHLYSFGQSDSTFVKVYLNFSHDKDALSLSNNDGNSSWSYFVFQFDIKPNTLTKTLYGDNYKIYNRNIDFKEFLRAESVDSLKQIMLDKSQSKHDSIVKMFVIDYTYSPIPGSLTTREKEDFYNDGPNKSIYAKWNHNVEDSVFGKKMHHLRTILSYSENPNLNDSSMRNIHSTQHQTFHSSLYKLIAPYDISQSYYAIYPINFYWPLTDSLNNRNLLSIHFGSAIDPSNINVEPDSYQYNGFYYTDIDKLRVIDISGLRFHIKFRQFENLQTLRNFVLTTLLGFCVAIFFNTFWKMIRRKSRRKYFEYIKIQKRNEEDKLNMDESPSDEESKEKSQ